MYVCACAFALCLHLLGYSLRGYVSTQEIEPHTIENFFGLTDAQKACANESGYILFYHSRE